MRHAILTVLLITLPLTAEAAGPVEVVGPRLWVRSLGTARGPVTQGLGSTRRPLYVDGRLYLSTGSVLLGLDVATGEVVWRGAIDSLSDEALRQAGHERNAIAAWRRSADRVGGQVAVVGRRLFHIQRTLPPPAADRPSNVLRVYRLDETAEALRDTHAVGGAGPADDPLKNNYWLAPPVADESGTKLHLPAERSDGIWMVCLDARTLKLVWRTQLTKTRPADRDGRRRGAGSPVYVDERWVVWSDGTGWVHALTIDGKPGWRHAYDSGNPQRPSRIVPVGRDALLLLPSDAGELLKLDLGTGEARWKSVRFVRDAVLLGMSETQVYSSDVSRVRAFDLDSGMLRSDPPPRALVGEVALVGQRLLAPTTTGIDTLDAATLKTLARVERAALFPAEPDVRLGDLLLCDDVVISVSPTHLVAIATRAHVARRLADLDGRIAAAEQARVSAAFARAEWLSRFGRHAEAVAALHALHAQTSASGSMWRIRIKLRIPAAARAAYDQTRDAKHLETALPLASGRERALLRFALAEHHRAAKVPDKARPLYEALAKDTAWHETPVTVDLGSGPAKTTLGAAVSARLKALGAAKD